MRFRTEINLQDSEKKMKIDDALFSIGSCFATEISELLQKGQLQVLNNPYGTIFNPYSINNAIRRIHDAEDYQEGDLIAYKDDYISLDHHSSFSADYAHKTLQNINIELEKANAFLQKSNWVIITYGTSFIYEFLPKQKLVANCHKIPQKFFKKRLLTPTEIQNSIAETISLLNDICKTDVQILFTISPVRHTKDGIIENNWSKSQLISGVHEAIADHTNCHYLPIYELMMDDLRDYRFYKDDLIHPNSQAINYIFEKFGNAFFSDETMEFVEENFKIAQALAHKTQDESQPEYVAFREKIQQRIALQQQKVKHRIFDK